MTKAWFIIGPKGGVFRDCEGSHFCASTRKWCIETFVGPNCYGGTSIEMCWDSFQKLGYTCQRRKISED